MDSYLLNKFKGCLIDLVSGHAVGTTSEEGYMSCTRKCFNTESTVYDALLEFTNSGNSIIG